MCQIAAVQSSPVPMSSSKSPLHEIKRVSDVNMCSTSLTVIISCVGDVRQIQVGMEREGGGKGRDWRDRGVRKRHRARPVL